LRALREAPANAQRKDFAVLLDSLLSIVLFDSDERSKAIETFHNVPAVAASTGIDRTILNSGRKSD
jgi:hypothetical protein